MHPDADIYVGPPFPRPPSSSHKPPARPWVNIVLFVLTFVSAMWSQMSTRPNETFSQGLMAPLFEPERLLEGLPFALVLMTILLAHEMGHYLTARHYGVNQSLPYFIPAPTIFGTLGAVILMRSQPENRRHLLNVAIAGPYAGLALAIPAAAWGLAHSVPVNPALLAEPYNWFGSSLLFGLLEQLFSPNGSDVALHPVAFAGWVGMFVTSLNLIPAAQLDGGHVAYALFGRRQRPISVAVVVGLLATGVLLGMERGAVWVVWAVLLLVVGLRHPPVRQESVRLTMRQRVNGYVALIVFAVTFIPVPLERRDPAPEAPGVYDLAPIERPWPAGEDDPSPVAPEEFRL